MAHDWEFPADVSALPMPVSLIGFATEDDNHAKVLLAKFAELDDEWMKEDLSQKFRKDPSQGGVGWKENGEHPNTQRIMFSLENFADEVKAEFVKIAQKRDS